MFNNFVITLFWRMWGFSDVFSALIMTCRWIDVSFFIDAATRFGHTNTRIYIKQSNCVKSSFLSIFEMTYSIINMHNVLRPTCVALGIRFQIVPLKDSLAFWVFPWRHFFSIFSLHKLLQIGRITFLTSIGSSPLDLQVGVV